MWLPKDICQAAKAYGGDDLQKIEHFIEGAKCVWEMYDLGDKSMAFVSEAKDEGLDFETFWSAYNYKKAKPQARRMWVKLTREQKIEIMQSIPAYLASLGGSKEFQMHPATYINPNNERWKDELTVRNNGTKQSTNNNVTEQDFFASEAQRLSAGLAAARAKENN